MTAFVRFEVNSSATSSCIMNFTRIPTLRVKFWNRRRLAAVLMEFWALLLVRDSRLERRLGSWSLTGWRKCSSWWCYRWTVYHATMFYESSEYRDVLKVLSGDTKFLLFVTDASGIGVCFLVCQLRAKGGKFWGASRWNVAKFCGISVSHVVCCQQEISFLTLVHAGFQSSSGWQNRAMYILVVALHLV